MTKIIYIEPEGQKKEIEVENGTSVMEGAVANNVEGIVAECGGACSCATCHSYIEASWLERLPPMDDMEDCMLDMNDSRQPNSRLTCQIKVTDELDGLIVNVADNES